MISYHSENHVIPSLQCNPVSEGTQDANETDDTDANDTLYRPSQRKLVSLFFRKILFGWFAFTWSSPVACERISTQRKNTELGQTFL